MRRNSMNDTPIDYLVTMLSHIKSMPYNTVMMVVEFENEIENNK